MKSSPGSERRPLWLLEGCASGTPHEGGVGFSQLCSLVEV
jgi:hypothetical protein